MFDRILLRPRVLTIIVKHLTRQVRLYDLRSRCPLVSEACVLPCLLHLNTKELNTDIKNNGIDCADC